MSIGERVLKIRKDAKLTRHEFGKKIGISQDAVANIEYDRNVKGVPDSIIKLICYEFNVNENWLRTGEGEMLTPRDKKEELSATIDKFLKNENDSFKERLISVLIRLDESDWKVLENIAIKIVNDKAKNESAATTETKEITVDLNKLSIDEKVELYRQELEREEKAEAKFGA